MDRRLSAALRLDAWTTAKSKERRALARAVADARAADLELVHEGVGELAVPVYAHRATGFLLHLIPGGRFTMGLTEAELAKLRARYEFFNEADQVDAMFASPELGPPTAIDLPAFLFGARPLGGKALEWLREPVASRSPRPDPGGKRAWDYAKVAKLPADQYLAYLDRSGAGEGENEDVAPIEAALHALGLRLPSDAEWERVARGGDDRALTLGDEIPDSPDVPANGFGISGMGATCEPCADGWVDTLEGIPKDGSARPPAEQRVVRGGAALIYPWQGCGEWTLLACATRKSLEGEDGLLSIRCAMSL